jgi:hypothetical protein
MPDATEEEPTTEEVEEALRTFSEEKANVHTFLTKVIREKDNTKIGNVTEPELGQPSHTIRMYKELEAFCNTCDMPYFADYFKSLANVTLGTGLSKEGFLLQLAVIQKRELTTGGKKTLKQNRGWFRSRRTSAEEEFQ